MKIFVIFSPEYLEYKVKCPTFAFAFEKQTPKHRRKEFFEKIT